MHGTLKYDLVIKGGMIIDGMQTPRYRAAIGIRDGMIVEIGSNIAVAGTKKLIDAKGKIVAPGFVDLQPIMTASCSGTRGAPCRAGTGSPAW